MAQIVLFNKPFNVLTQFRTDDERVTLARFIHNKDLRVAGRLDFDSEGLLLLTDNGQINQQLVHPRAGQYKTYLVQVEGSPEDTALQQLQQGVMLKDGLTLPAKARVIEEPDFLWPRNPPIRFRASIPTTWLEIKICEGKNRQVRRMTAAVGLPTLRLIRIQIGPFLLNDLQPGELKTFDTQKDADLLAQLGWSGRLTSSGRSAAKCFVIESSAAKSSVSKSLADKSCADSNGDSTKQLPRSSLARKRNRRRNTLPMGPRGK